MVLPRVLRRGTCTFSTRKQESQKASQQRERPHSLQMNKSLHTQSITLNQCHDNRIRPPQVHDRQNKRHAPNRYTSYQQLSFPFYNNVTINKKRHETRHFLCKCCLIIV
ncbi:hypothetical protein HMPREF9135_0904 [Segatella baroniae F0067]|uniref:Uncharacterized protein n=1 Tax=Segatella baroniae F0067 TaxID=1115809 RepID=U2QAN3_9BACT|nr:hypothetical protein HMPREF9135_0904 [Segatella baroniae F0067]